MGNKDVKNKEDFKEDKFRQAVKLSLFSMFSLIIMIVVFHVYFYEFRPYLHNYVEGSKDKAEMVEEVKEPDGRKPTEE